MRDISDFLAYLPPLPLPEEMRHWDQAAYDLGLPPVMLMENAARSAFEVLRGCRPHLRGERVWLFMGSGNNGGDAAGLARRLMDAGAEPLVLHAKPLSGYTGAAAKHIRMARAAGVRFTPLSRHDFAEPPGLIVDGLLGTGFRGELRPEMHALVTRINSLSPSRFVLALDIPSGLDGISGLPSPVAIRADATVSFAAAKPGLLLPHAAPWVGTLHVRSIGIPAAVRTFCTCSAYLLDGHCLAAIPAPRAMRHKGDFGHVLVLGGRPGLGGAAHLAARSALRAGAGLVTACAPHEALRDIKNGWAEIMTRPLTSPGSDSWPDAPPADLTELHGRRAALVVGPGMGRGEDAARFLAALLDIPDRPPTVLDADALVLLARNPRLFARIGERDILTPHPGEAATMLGCTAADVQADRCEALKRLCALQAGVAILKGAGSLVGQAGAPVLLCPYDIPQLSAGGAGDVLAGCLGALLARGDFSEFPALCAAGIGTVLHALAGRRCAETWPQRGNLASDISDALPHVRASLALAPSADDMMLPWPA